MPSLKTLLLAGLALLGTNVASAQNGRIAGLVVDADFGSPLLGVTISVADTDFTATTNLRGKFAVNDVPTGVYQVNFLRTGYRFSTVTDVVVTAGETTRLDFPLPISQQDVAGDIIELEEFTITAEVLANSEIGLLADREKAVSISDAIGAESFSRLGLGDAAEAMGKVTGASVEDGKYVYIRGLGDRYSNTLLNNTTVPSADPDRRAVQMDQFPTDLLDSIVTSKSFTPDQPGSFSGGAVNIKTKSFPDNFFVSFSSSIGFNTQATGEDILISPADGDTDWLAMDDGTRELPLEAVGVTTSFTSARVAARRGDLSVAEELDAATRAFPAYFFPEIDSGTPPFSFATAVGDTIELENGQLIGYTVSVTYGNSVDHYDDGILSDYRDLTRYDQTPPELNYALTTNFNPDPTQFSFNDLLGDQVFPWGTQEETPWGVTKSSQNVNWGVFTKLSYQPLDNHEMSLDLFHNQSASDEVTRGVGEFESGNSNTRGLIWESYDMLYTERGISSIQLAGKSVFTELAESTLEWRASWSRSTQDQPDYRTVITIYDPDREAYSQETTPPPQRVFRELEETQWEYGLDWTFPYEMPIGWTGNLKFGGMYSESTRDYEENAFQIQPDQLSSREDLENLYTPGTIGLLEVTDRAAGGFDLQWGRAIQYLGGQIEYFDRFATQRYEGDQRIWAAYAMFDHRFNEKFRMIGGVRVESTSISVAAGTPQRSEPIVGEVDEQDLLPAFHFVYTIREGMNLRFAYGRTVARPIYKELAAVAQTDFFRNQTYIGNADIEMTKIDNFDLRWEWFRGNGIFAVSLFYKELDKPIEVLFSSELQGSAIQPQNVETGEVTGIELEWRVFLDEYTDALAGFSVGGNFSYVDSAVTIPEDELTSLREDNPNVEDTRPLRGQAQYTFNFDVSWENFDWGTSATASYGVSGERLDLVTLGSLPDYFQKPAPSFDLIIAQRIGDNWTVKFTAGNLLDPSYEVVLDSDPELLVESYKKGRNFSLSFTYLFE